MRAYLTFLALSLLIISTVRADELDEVINMEDSHAAFEDYQSSDPHLANDSNTVREPATTEFFPENQDIPKPKIISDDAPVSPAKPSAFERHSAVSKKASKKRAVKAEDKSGVTISFADDEKLLEKEKREKELLNKFYQIERTKKKKTIKRNNAFVSRKKN